MNLQIVDDSATLAATAAERVVQLAERSIQAHGRFTIALAGGSTPRSAYQLLAQPPLRDRVRWDQVYVFWGDERLVPAHDPNNNAHMARAAWLDHIPIPAEHIRPVPVELEDPHAVAAAYEQTLLQHFGLASEERPRFDLVLLGMGEDGHTASLFPGTLALHERDRLVVANYVDKLSAWRITLTLPAINAADHVLFLVSGAGKAQVLAEVLRGPRDPERLPSQLIRPGRGLLTWLVDRPAAALLETRS